MPYKDPAKRREIIRKSVAKLRQRVRIVERQGISGDILQVWIGAQMKNIMDGREAQPCYLRAFSYRDNSFIMFVNPDKTPEEEVRENMLEAKEQGFDIDPSEEGIKSILEGLTWDPIVFKLELTEVKKVDSRT